MANPNNVTGQGRLKQVRYPNDFEINEYDADELDTTDAESMFDMFTGDVNDPGSRDGDEMTIDDTRSEASWEGVEEYEHTRFDVDMRQFDREFVHLPRGLPTVPVTEPKDVRTLNAEATEAYQWESLAGTSAIRLFDMLPAEDPNEPIQAQTKLSGRVNYWAVSYSNVSPDHQAATAQTKAIPCDGKILRVTPEIYDMLRRIRGLLDEDTWTEFHTRPCIWVDAVCIDPNIATGNKDYTYEATDIFRGAQGTMIYLGDDTYDVSALFTTAEAFWTAQNGDPTNTDWPVGAADRDTTVAAMRTFIAHPWFRQRDIIPEFAANKRRTIVCGHSSVRFEALLTLMAHLDLIPAHSPIRHVSQIDGLWPKTWLFANLYRYRHCPPTSDPITPLLHITCTCGSQPHEPAATPAPSHGHLPWCGRASCGAKSQPPRLVPSPSLYTDLAYGYAHGNSTIAVLALAAAFPSSSSPSSSAARRLPSWVPDWDVAHACPTLPAATQALLDAELEHPSARALFTFAREGDVWQFPPVGKGQDEPQERSGICVGVRTELSGRVALRVRGWLLQRPERGTRVEGVDWERWGEFPGARVEGGEGVKWRNEKVRFLKERGERVRVMDVGEDWPELREKEVVLFLPCYELMFVLEMVEGERAFRLVRFLRRTVVMDKPRFVFVDREKEEVWAYGHLKRPPHALDII